MADALGRSADAIYNITLQIKELDAKITVLKAKRTTAEKNLMSRMEKSEVASIRGSKAIASFSDKTVYKVDDWEAYYKYVHRWKAYDLLHKAASSTAIALRIEDGKKVPGISKIEFTKLSVRKNTKSK